MQSVSSSFAARFHENGDVEDSRWSDHASGDSDDDSEVRSMTAKGISYLCSELLELKAESNGDFHRIIISSCISFSRAFEKVKAMQQDLMDLKSNISTQTKLVKDLLDGMDLDIESDETVVSTLQASEYSGISCLIELEAHIYEVSNTLDALICANKINEALEIVKLEDENLQRLKVEEEHHSFDLVMLYDCVISDKKAKIMLRLAQKTPAGGGTDPTAERPPSVNSPKTHQVPQELMNC
ncbi:uncharacterized protein LOC111463888 [Cucurbita moschata]|uniref:Uncharacterized protein LOC111463888 n=1 Tax=Cucurbita moschata TaxID=3662 RepID=A0A6J1HIG6_CUCMO|nr:uncharacterized protein LOC111463888 [Cucurbita moschata]